LDLEANNGNNACVESNLADAFAAICDDIEGGEDYAEDHDEDEDQTNVEGEKKRLHNSNGNSEDDGDDIEDGGDYVEDHDEDEDQTNAEGEDDNSKGHAEEDARPNASITLVPTEEDESEFIKVLSPDCLTVYRRIHIPEYNITLCPGTFVKGRPKVYLGTVQMSPCGLPISDCPNHCEHENIKKYNHLYCKLSDLRRLKGT